MPVIPHFRVVGLIGVDVAEEAKRAEPDVSGEEDSFEDQNDTSPLSRAT